jgi:acyl-coenzyme A thioesterase PaaI-like protein
VSEAFYVPLGGDLFSPTKATVGPWDPRFQHGGPPVALLVRALEQCEPVAETLLARLAAEFIGPVPVAEVEVSARVLRAGRRVQLLEAEMTSEGRPVLRARAWRLRCRPQPGLTPVGSVGPPVLPPVALPSPLPFFADGYARAMEWRVTAGSSLAAGPATVWCRLRGAVVEGEEPSPVQRVAAAADSGNGISWVLDFEHWSFVNVDLTVHLVRPPSGEWICLDARTQVDPDGVALASTTLYDENGRIGVGAQSLLVAPR